MSRNCLHRMGLLLALGVALALGGCKKSEETSPPRITMHDAARIGDLGELRTNLYWRPDDLNKRNRDGLTPLSLAVMHGQLEAAKLLIEKGAKVGEADGKGITPLRRATSQPTTGLVSLLLEKGADVNEQAAGGDSALHAAAWMGSPELLQLLLGKGANVAANDAEGRTALHVAVANGNVEMAQALLAAGAKPAARDRDGNAALHVAMELYFTSAGPGSTTTDQARTDRSLSLIRLLLKAGADPNALNRSGRSPLHTAVFGRSVAMLNLLLDSGATLTTTQPSSGTTTPLHAAVDQGAVEMASILLDRGASPSLLDGQGRSPLHIAVGRGAQAVVRLLLRRGAQAGERTADGKSALDLARGYADCPVDIVYMLDAASGRPGLPLHDAIRMGDKAAVARLAGDPAALSAGDAEGRTALHVAVGCLFWDEREETCSTAMDIVGTLLGVKASATAKDKLGRTPLHAAVLALAQSRRNWSTGRIPTLATLMNRVGKSLLEGGAEVDARDLEQMTPLHHAAARRAREAAAFLLENKADRGARDKYSRIPLDLARESYDAPTINLLRENPGEK